MNEMLNKIQNNVHSMLAQARKITTRKKHRSHSHKKTIEIDSYLEHTFSAHPPIVASEKTLSLLKKVKKRSATQNQHHALPSHSSKRIKTQTGYPFIQYRLQQHSQKKHIMRLEPNESELLSTKIFGLNKPKYLTKKKHSNLPTIKATKPLHSYHKTQFNLQDHLGQMNTMKKERGQLNSKLNTLQNLYSQQNLIRFRERRKHSQPKYFKQRNQSKNNIQSTKRELIEIHEVQPWESEGNQNFQFNR